MITREIIIGNDLALIELMTWFSARPVQLDVPIPTVGSAPVGTRFVFNLHLIFVGRLARLGQQQQAFSFPLFYFFLRLTRRYQRLDFNLHLFLTLLRSSQRSGSSSSSPPSRPGMFGHSPDRSR